ncbi:MAG: hypothetical protein M3447_00835 [Acidobacteriota bacterium]|nr:hypothetical protein [Acidobacteriota bacterium]
MTHHRFFATLLILQCSLGAFAQQQPAPTASPSQSVPGPQQRPAKKADEDDVVRISTNVVQLDAVVTDSKLHHISMAQASLAEVETQLAIAYG